MTTACVRFAPTTRWLPALPSSSNARTTQSGRTAPVDGPLSIVHSNFRSAASNSLNCPASAKPFLCPSRTASPVRERITSTSSATHPPNCSAKSPLLSCSIMNPIRSSTFFGIPVCPISGQRASSLAIASRTKRFGVLSSSPTIASTFTGSANRSSARSSSRATPSPNVDRTCAVRVARCDTTAAAASESTGSPDVPERMSLNFNAICCSTAVIASSSVGRPSGDGGE